MFFILPVGVDYRAERYPVVTFWLIGINFLVFLTCFVIEWNGGDEAVRTYREWLWLTPSQLNWHTLLTSMFVHVGWLHLLGNMVYLFLFGGCVEDLIGRGKFVLFYFVGGLAASVTHMASVSASAGDIPTGGASGAISACMGGFVLLLPKTDINFRYWYWILVRFGDGDFSLPSWLVMSFWFVTDLVAAFQDAGSGEGGVAFAAHVGGFVGGLAPVLAGIVMRRYRDAKAGVAAQSSSAEAVSAPLTAKSSTPVQSPDTGLPCIYLHSNGEQAGPFTLSQIQQFVADGRVGTDAQYWSEGMEQWRSVAELL